MPTPRDLLEVLGTFCAARHDEGILAAFVFGGLAESRQHRESDVDIAVLLNPSRYPGEQDRFEARVRLTSELIGVLHSNEVDLVVLNDAPPLLARRILYQGKEVYCSSRSTLRDFGRDVQLRAADLEPFLRRMGRLKLEAVLQ